MDNETQNVAYICNWNELCRLCLRNDGSMQNLFVNESLLDAVREATSLSFHENDMLPDLICQECADHVNTFVEFRDRCRVTDAWLRHEVLATDDDHKDVKQEEPEDIMNTKDLLIEPNQFEEQLIDDPAPIDDSIENEIELANCIIQTEEVLLGTISGVETLSTNSVIHKCTVCNKELLSACKFADHMRRHAGERPYGCNVCEKFFKTKSNLNEHYRVHNPQLRWMKTSSKDLPSLTRVTVTSDEALTCSHCDEPFESLEDLAVHESGHQQEDHSQDEILSEELLQSVEECEPTVPDGNCPEVSVGSASSNGTGRNCPYCGKSFRSLATLENHKRVHTREKPFACDLCSKPFRTKGNLLEHKRVHDNSLWLMKSDTRLAMDTAVANAPHGNGGPKGSQQQQQQQQRYKCGHCSKPFRTHTALLNHERVHTREKPFECSVCEKCFRTKSNMTEHMKGCHDMEWSRSTNSEEYVEVFTFKNTSPKT